MNDRLLLHIPALHELDYRQRIMADPETMSYNKGYDISFNGYHKDTGCIDFPESEWQEWYDYYIGQEPERFYAYILRREDSSFIGEVNLHRSSDSDSYEMGILLEACHRGRGYSKEALSLLLAYAFEVLGAESVRNAFEDTRDAAVRTHLACGFQKYKHDNGILEFLIRKEGHAQ